MYGCVVVVCVLAIGFASLSLQDKPYHFNPESNHLEVNGGDDYYIGFDEIGETEFVHCYYESDTINGDYKMGVNSNEQSVQSDFSSGFKPYNDTRTCALIYYTVDDAAPLRWIITAFDNLTKHNFSEIVTIDRYFNLPLYVTTLYVLPSGSYANFFLGEDRKFTNCTVRIGNVSINLDLNKIKVYDKDVFKSRLSSLGGGRCGFKIDKIIEGDATDLTLLATDEQDKKYKNISTLGVKIVPELKNRTVEVYLGDGVEINCGDTSLSSEQRFCSLYNPQGNLIYRIENSVRCKYNLDIVTKDDLGVWRCSVGYKYMMDAVELTTELVEKKTETVTTFSEEATDFLAIGCIMHNLPNELKDVNYCKFTRPDGKIFKVTYGSASQYYTTFTSDLSNGKCSLEILKPLRNEDKGTWKCDALLGEGVMMGAFLDVETTSSHNNKYIRKNVQLGSPFVIDCRVSYSSDSCHITAPNGTQYRPDRRYYTNTGLCSLDIDEAAASDHGAWSCSFEQKQGLPDETITVDISIIELTLLYTNVEALQNEQVELICNTNGIPIEYCRFTSPSGLTYSLRKKDLVTSTGIAYNGRGLEFGDCGIKISKVKNADAGEWRCDIGSGRSSEKMTHLSQNIKLEITSSNTSVAEAVGIAVGVVAVLVATAAFIYIKKYRSSRTRSSPEEENSRHSNSSDQNIILSVQQNTYNT